MMNDDTLISDFTMEGSNPWEEPIRTRSRKKDRPLMVLSRVANTAEACGE